MYLKTKSLNKRYSIFPIIHPDLWEDYKKAEKQTWVAEEIDLSKDRYDELLDDEKKYLKNNSRKLTIFIQTLPLKKVLMLRLMPCCVFANQKDL